MNEPAPLLDAELVALVHGELDADAERAVRRRLADDPEARARHAVLAATDQALCEALDTRAAAAAAARREWLRPLLAVAAVFVVALVFVFQPGARDEAGRNEFVELKVAPRGGASHPLFTHVELALRWRGLGTPTTWRYVQVVPYGFGDTPEALAAKAYASETHGKILPVVVTAELRAPDGTVLTARLRPDGKPPLVDSLAGEMLLVATLREFEVQAAPQPLYLGGAPVLRGWQEDFQWQYRNLPRGQQPRSR